MLVSPLIAQSHPTDPYADGFSLSSVAAADGDDFESFSPPQGSPASPGVPSSGATSSYSAAYTVRSVNSVKSRKNILYPRRDRLRESLAMNSPQLHNTYDDVNHEPSGATATLADLERWRLSARPGPPERPQIANLGECVTRALKAVFQGSSTDLDNVGSSLERAGVTLRRMCQADKVDPDTSEGYLVQRYADAILAIYDAAMANKEFGLQLFEGSCAALADTLEKAYRYFHEPETELPRPKQIDAADTKLFQEYVISASCNSDLNGALEKAAVALRTIDMMRTTKLTSFSETQQDGGTQRSRDQESRGRSGTITQQTVSMSFPLQAQKDARQALQAMRTSQVEALENDLARLRFFIWRVVNPVAKNELQAIVEEVLPHYHVHLVREDA